MKSKHQDNQSRRWKIEGHYPGRTFGKDEYHFDSKYVENNINQFNIKILNNTLENTVVCSFADFITSGEITAVWDSDDPSSEASKLQQHEGFELMFVVKGPCNGVMEYTPFTLKSGDCLLLNPNIRNLYYFTPDTLLVSVSITPKYIRRFFIRDNRITITPSVFHDFIVQNMSSDTYKSKDFVRFFYKGSDAFNSTSHGLIQNMYTELRKKEPGYEYMVEGLLIRLFHSLINPEEYDIQKENQFVYSGEELVEVIRLYLDTNKRKISLKELSMHFHYNGNYLCRIFQNKIGQTIREYNTEICMQEALSLLKETNLPITEIALRIGFSSRAQFYKLFEQRYGEKPLSFRSWG